MTNDEIQKHIEQNCRHKDGSPAMDEQAFYEGAKWMRDKALSLHNVVASKGTLCVCKSDHEFMITSGDSYLCCSCRKPIA